MNLPLFTAFLFLSAPVRALEFVAGYGHHKPLDRSPVAEILQDQSFVARCQLLITADIESQLLFREAIPCVPTRTQLRTSEKDSKSFSYPHDTLDPGIS